MNNITLTNREAEDLVDIFDAYKEDLYHTFNEDDFLTLNELVNRIRAEVEYNKV